LGKFPQLFCLQRRHLGHPNFGTWGLTNSIWSFVGHKGNPRWLWHAIDHHTGKVLSYVFGRRQDGVFLQLKALLEPFGLTRYYTDYVRRESSR
jgi:IS1 family transposase